MARRRLSLVPHFSAGRKAPTFFGWTPGLHRLVGGQLLGCGCLIGVYETNGVQLVKIIDRLAAQCTVSGHAVNLVLDTGTMPATPGVLGEILRIYREFPETPGIV